MRGLGLQHLGTFSDERHEAFVHEPTARACVEVLSQKESHKLGQQWQEGKVLDTFNRLLGEGHGLSAAECKFKVMRYNTAVLRAMGKAAEAGYISRYGKCL